MGTRQRARRADMLLFAQAGRGAEGTMPEGVGSASGRVRKRQSKKDRQTWATCSPALNLLALRLFTAPPPAGESTRASEGGKNDYQEH